MAGLGASVLDKRLSGDEKKLLARPAFVAAAGLRRPVAETRVCDGGGSR